MNKDLKNILSEGDKEIDDAKLMDYLASQLSEAESHEVEKGMAEDAFMNDAVEGLQQIENKKHMQAYVEQLNKGLHKHIATNKKRKDKRRLKDYPYTYITVVILLILLVISFVILKKHLDARRPGLPARSQNTSVTPTP